MEEVNYMCLGNNPGKLVAYDRGNGRIDMEFSSDPMVSEGNLQFYVYDAYNDGDLSGPEDKALIRNFNSKDGCNHEVTNCDKDVRGDTHYKDLFQESKMRVIKYHIRSLLVSTPTPLGYNKEVTQDRTGYVTFFKSSDIGGTNLNISDKIFPEGMNMIRKAVRIAELIDKAALAMGVVRDDVTFDMDLCDSYECNCHVYDNQPMWAALEKRLDLLTSPCPEGMSQEMQFESLRCLLDSLPLTLKGIIRGSKDR